MYYSSLGYISNATVLFLGAHLRQRSLDTERRRQSLGTIIPHRASDAFLDPYHAAILFRDARGLPVVDPFLEKVNISDLGSRNALKTRV
ncbi:5'-AMP-activated protein kinase subunit gamma-2-like Protein [Tribolium castaneum]|uniref:5'-AMP-activated protein kinase subunit gamma-2-like Protein n=1 Tax=Tribolium castaneum TaxID=7070 RepID=A0A139WHH9_TRICA|nr:5'-AMP-activated protein kinase subunit gamma-2-like Protein [Tribolium castaneum]